MQVLEALHGFRSSSLHPWHPHQAASIGLDKYVEASARLADLFVVLDEIARRREKALIFLESIELQPVLAEIVRQRYQLPRQPLIVNGRIAGPARQRAVDEFQAQSTDFDTMILSPRAGGVGLTLTAANHVIHLSRWWNPAVEDQCTDRVFRIGQTREVTVHLLLAEHPTFAQRSYDLVLDQLLEEKRSVARSVFAPTEISAGEIGRRMGAPQTDTGAIDLVELDRMEPLAFEAWVASQARAIGLEAQATPRSWDGGADLVLRSSTSKRTILVQCKHRADPDRPMDEAPLNDLDRAVRAYSGPDALLAVATNAKRFTDQATSRARASSITLLARDRLISGLRGLAEAVNQQRQ
jgi:hypothetical protein